MSSNAAVSVLAQMLSGLTAVRALDPHAPDLSASVIEAQGEHGVMAVITLPTGDTYRVTVEWLSEESP